MADDESLEAKIKLDLIDTLESRIQDRFESDRTFIRETVGAAVKILTVALTIVAVILTLFGIKTISDINEVIVETTKDEIGARLDKANPVVKYAAEVETMYNNVLIKDLDLKIKSNTLPRQIKISDDELARILATLDHAETPNKTFTLGISVLIRTAIPGQWDDISKKFKTMLTAKDPYRWIEGSDVKRTALIKALQSRADQSHSVIRDIAMNTKGTTSLRTAAIEFLGVTGDYDEETIKYLENLAKGSNQSLNKAAILALARINPTSEAVGDWIINISEKSGLPKLVSAFELIDTLLQGPSGSPNKPAGNSKVVAEHVVTIFERLSTSGVALKYQQEVSTENISTNLVVYRPEEPLNYFPVPASSVFSWKSSNALREVIKRAVRSSEQGELSKVISFLTIAWGDTEHVGAAVHATLSGRSRIETQQGPSLTSETLPSGAILLARQGDSISPVRAVWSNAGGTATSSIVMAIEGVEQVEFVLRRADSFGYVFLPLR